MKKSNILLTVHFALWLAVTFTLHSAAYIDPSAVSGLLVAISGAVVACSAVIFIIWRKFKKKVSETFGIDENANKEVEEDIIIKEDVENENNDQQN